MTVKPGRTRVRALERIFKWFLTLILERLGLRLILVLVCAVGIRKGAVGMIAISAILSGIMTIFLR